MSFMAERSDWIVRIASMCDLWACCRHILEIRGLRVARREVVDFEAVDFMFGGGRVLICLRGGKVCRVVGVGVQKVSFLVVGCVVINGISSNSDFNLSCFLDL